jgi:predicted transcriptional regulator
MRKPRGFCYDKDKYCKERLTEFIEGRRKTLNISQRELGAKIGMTQQAFSNRVSNCSFTFLQAVKILECLKATDDEKLSLMKHE